MRRVTRLFLLSLAAAFTLLAQQAMDSGYGAKIKEATTSPEFLTELVDHLPASDKVPTPEKFHGYIAGAPNRLTYAKDVHRYMRAVAEASPRVRVVSMGQTEEGREMVLVLVSDESNLARLDRLKEITHRLGDPRRTTDAEADALINEGVPLYWATAAIHSSETAAPEMLMELVYRLAVEESPFIQAIRRNMVVLVTPVIEVDGRERQVDLYRLRKEDPRKAPTSLVYWGKYVAHDNNRDGMVLSLALSRNVTKTFLEYMPQVFHDLHESVPFLYTSTGMGPYNAWLDPIVISEWQKLAYHEIEEMTKRGVPGIWTHGFYDGWAANYMMLVAHGHNSIGRFYETFGNGGADTRDRTVPANQTTRTWFRPNPPYPRVQWSHRNNVNMAQSALLLAMNYTARNKDTFLKNFYLKSKRSVAKATTEGPAAYTISAAERPHEAASLVDLLKTHGVEVHRLNSEPRNYVVRMDQPFSRLADMLLDKQYYSVNDTAPYDDTGWTLGALRNLNVTRITDTKFLQTPMTQVTGPHLPEGKVEGSGSAAWIINHNGDRVLATARWKLAGVKILAAEDAFEAGGRKFNAGSFIITGAGNRVEAVARELGLTVTAVSELPKVPTHELAAPRIALVHNWTNTQNEGWFRLAFDELKVPYTYISDQQLGRINNLRDRFDVIILGPMGGSAQRIVNGIPMRGEPIPWKASSLTPNFGTSPDTTDDMRGGMGLEGLSNLQKFISNGGLFVTIGANASLPIDYGLVEGVSIQQIPAVRARGSVLEATVGDAKSPIAYGYDTKLPVYFNQAPILNVSAAGAFGFGGGGGGGQGQAQPQGRVSGRGGPGDPDVVQGRPPQPPAPPAPAGGPLAEMPESARALMPPPEEQPRTILRFSPASDLLISGMLAGGSDLAGKPVVVDVPLGKGHIVLFANNPMWRQQTQGSWMLLLNAAMNYNNLHVGRPPAPEGGARGGGRRGGRQEQ